MVHNFQQLREAAIHRDNRNYAEAHQLYVEYLAVHGPVAEVLGSLAQIELALAIVNSDTNDMHGVKAIEWINQAIMLASSIPEYHFFFGVLHEYVDLDYQVAADAYRRSLQIEPLFVPALDRLAFLSGMPENVVSLDEGIRCGETVVRISPTRSRWLQLGSLYEWAGRQADAERALVKGLTAALETAPVQF